MDQDLPPDLFAALLELFVVSLAPRCTALAPQLLGAGAAQLAAVLCSAAALLSGAVNPRLTCWAPGMDGWMGEWMGGRLRVES